MTELATWLNANSLALWTIAVGALCNVSCAILGCYLVLRRMSMLGDAISHSVLPGLALAFVLTGSISGWGMVVGAAALGVLTAFLTQLIAKLADVPEDSSMGVVFTSLFAVGVILVTRVASQADLDPGCVLYGLIEFTPLDTVSLFGLEVPRTFRTLGPALAITLGFVALFWKELKIVSFDPALARAMGFRVGLIHYLLMAMVAGVTVSSFEAVGSILVIAMLIVPAATAHLLTDRLAGMLLWSTAVAILSAVFGYWLAARWNTSVAGMMAVVAGGLFASAVLVAPRHGIVSQFVRRARLALRIAREDVLAQLYRADEAAVGTPPLVAGLTPSLARVQLRRFGQIERAESGWKLTPTGRTAAAELVRSHRLWESFLTTRLDLPADHVHPSAERMEHYIDHALQEQIAADLADPRSDPHGRPIPPSPAQPQPPGA